MIAWFIEYAEAIAIAATLVVAVLAYRLAANAHGRASGLDIAVDHLAAHLGLTPEDLAEHHYQLHPDCRPVESDGSR